MKLKLICCDVFARLAYTVAARSEHQVDVELFPMLSHIEPDRLRRNLQEALDKASLHQPFYDKIILAYGLCGNAVAGLHSTLPLLIPRMHDCCAMFMGSQKEFLRVFGHRLSTRWRSSGYMERCGNGTLENYKLDPEYLRLVAEYGEENADYIWETMSAPIETEEVIYITLEGLEYGGGLDRYSEQMAQESRKVEVVEGNAYWFERLINGPWEPGEFLEVLPGNKIEPIYDMNEVFKEVKNDI